MKELLYRKDISKHMTEISVWEKLKDLIWFLRKNCLESELTAEDLYSGVQPWAKKERELIAINCGMKLLYPLYSSTSQQLNLN